MSSKRLAFIDLLRGWAVIVMIETHMINATIIPDLRSTGLFDAINFINGLVAPSFLFASGMAYAVTTRRKLETYLSLGRPLFKQIGRLLFILLLGYGLHLPAFNLGKIMAGVTPRQWLVFFQADVLHCIAVSLLTLQLLLLVVRTERRLYRTAMAVAIAILIATPWVWKYDFLELLPAPIAAYMNGMHFSLFPLFPWMAFLFAGAITGDLFARGLAVAGEAGAGAYAEKALRWFAGTGIGLLLLSAALIPLASLVPSYDVYALTPSFALLRIGIVVLLCAAMYLYETRRGVSASSPVTLIGRESLLVYSVHLLLIYGNFGQFNFRNSVNHTLGFGGVALWTVILLSMMYLLALVWDWIKHKGGAWRRGVQLATVLVLILVFVFGPGQ
jgi:uncharacterized membrane protein